MFGHRNQQNSHVLLVDRSGSIDGPDRPGEGLLENGRTNPPKPTLTKSYILSVVAVVLLELAFIAMVSRCAGVIRLWHRRGGQGCHDRFPSTEIKVLRGVGKPRLVKRLQPSEPAKPATADGIEVYSLMANTAEVPKIELPPVYCGYEVLPEITLNKPGGYTYKG
ncbi:hypothetical protein B0T10DRAFT_594242 [Thelonectria olida]|uniref:Uncharacterized protein n=1 Tax=Thelonectria olida TaxID=1576542 RepID=A0A9P8W7L9_9HYPO|nr:hypothetical protein B0T10DRAFT_594242 [Thelonectria olida]